MSINDWRSNARPPQQPPPRDVAELNERMDEAERDRRVGAAVLAWECGWCGNNLRELPPGKLPHSCGYCLRTLRDAVAAALREEAGR